MNELFTRIARRTAHLAGSAPVFLGAVLLIVVWALTGPFFRFSETWQLIVNTGTTVVTFLMVFLIQSSQNHDSSAMQIKLDELIRAVNGAQNSLISLEDSTEDEMRKHADALRALAGVPSPGEAADESGAPVSSSDTSNGTSPNGH